ncbi:hypothetical protein JGS39_24085 [Streptomyces sp. P01-B04]|uniref:hypothetical protein n=1 Tax=Streptomyces poriferorum TaxID=2798799 RepID=UPI001C5F5459|nr:hypothetical protein [Streptomyces poriferorum]MBW5252042.1 hypothetical protein [Streptomyces poriferorum]MBW5260212.1 hypothetical protein [Streptomyces poriferorum]
MAEQQPLNLGTDVVLDAGGNGRAHIGPTYGPNLWHVQAISVRTSQPGAGLIPQCALYRGTEDANGYVDTTYDGSANSCDVNFDISQGTEIIAVWTGGNPGDVATLSVYGTRE